jgi:hypothetical protein
MFYILLIIPHLVLMAGFLWFAYTVSAGGGEDADAGWGRWDYDFEPPPGPNPAPGAGGPPLPDAGQPRRRLRVGERLAELYPRRLRRGHGPRVPDREPAVRERV